MDPELLAYVGGSVQQYRSRNADARQQDSGNAGRQTEPGAQDSRGMPTLGNRIRRSSNVIWVASASSAFWISSKMKMRPLAVELTEEFEHGRVPA
ncbi:MAG: hypothetical protein ACLPN6_25875 [Streptosporangiaceae bacterium]|jgi:hypothetical protein